jgi:hypothetical protein
MKYKHGIPKITFDELSKLMGEEKAKEYIKKSNYNYQAVITKIFCIRVSQIAKAHPILFWILLITILLFVSITIYDTVVYW